MGLWYHISEPNAYLAVTGEIRTVSITPFDFSMSLQAMTSEKLQFALPAVFTIGPADTHEALIKYATLLTGDQSGAVSSQNAKRTIGAGRDHVQSIVKGIIEVETRSIVSGMTMEELFNNRRMFRDRVIEYVQKELDQFGLRIYNANVKELEDLGDSRYFESLSMKAREGAQNQAQVDVANARMIGRVGEAEKEGQTKQEIAKINAHTAVLETERKMEKADADKKLRSREIETRKQLQLEEISADCAAQQKDAELQKSVEEKRAHMELEKQRATNVVSAKIARESAQEKADTELSSQQKNADAAAYQQKQDAEAVAFRSRQDADAAKYKQINRAHADLLSKEKEGQALYLMADKEAAAKAVKFEREATANYIAAEREAEADYITRKKEADGLKGMAAAYRELSNVLGGPQGLMQYLMLQNSIYTELSNANAKAINGLQPKINVWNTGAQIGSVDATAPIRNLIQTLPPMLSTIQEQTGMTAPSWLMGQPQPQHQPQQGQNGGMSREEMADVKQRLLNGHR
ncbi:hypothetical protein EJ03DRAFT_388873 [Teratosphaeria nubilosa]|uniref:Band 7 domain-containing protein n=1 Tax=Teratosphaeria nubilosa TaxID=161662 RepID=A0A6G1LCZ5_9PEZI|nr:hypothetical protein EJ03DRAFT_388873 [Teratosphaeria nubilosa]